MSTPALHFQSGAGGQGPGPSQSSEHQEGSPEVHQREEKKEEAKDLVRLLFYQS